MPLLRAVWVSLLRMVPPELVVVVILALTAAVVWYRHDATHWKTQHDLAQAAYDKKLRAASLRLLAAERSAREAEATWHTKFTSSQEESNAKIKKLEVELAGSVRVADRLRNATDLASRALRALASGQDPAAAAISETGARASELLSACAARYRGLAAEADRAVIAGQQCQQSYNALELELLK